jgi:hypothetical protein
VSRKARAIRYVIDPAIKIGINSGYEFAENYGLNAEPKHVVWTVKPGQNLSQRSDWNLFIYIIDHNVFTINEIIGRAMCNFNAS